MSFYFSPVVLPLAASALLSVVLAAYAWRNRDTPGAPGLAALMLAAAAWSLASGAYILGADLPTKRFFAGLQYAGIVCVPLGWLAFVLGYTDRGHWITPRRMLLLALPALATLLAIYTNDWHGLYWVEWHLSTLGELRVGHVEHGPWFAAHTAWSYALLALGVGLLVPHLLGRPALRRAQARALLAGVLTPWAVNMVFLATNLGVALDPTPFALSIAGLAFAWALFRFRLLDIVPVAREAMIESLPIGTMALDREFRVVDLNPAARRALALADTAGQPEGRDVADLLEHWPQLTQGMERETAGAVELRLGHGDAGRIFEVSWSPLPGEQDQVAGHLILWRDVTERRKAAAALRDQKSLFENLVAVAQATAQRPSLEATLQNCLDVAVSLSGAEGASLFLLDGSGRVQRSLYSSALGEIVETAEHSQQAMAKGLAGWVAREREPTLVADTQADPRWAPLEVPGDLDMRSAVSAPTTAGDSVLGVITLTHSRPGFFTDSDLHFVRAAAAQMGLALRNAQMFERQCELAESLAREHERLKELERARDDLTNTLVHDLRNPLTSVRGALEYLRTTMESAGQGQREMLEVAERSAERMARLTDSILTVSRLESRSLPIEPAWLDLGKLTEDALAQQAPQAQRKQLALESHFPEDTPRAWADPSLLARVLQNLVGNAVQATPPRGRIVVRFDGTQRGQMRVAVSDTGPGIPETLRSRLFGKFVTGTPGGSGLGLAFCRLAIEAMGGRIWLAEAAERGATFLFTLPLRPLAIPQEDALLD